MKGLIKFIETIEDERQEWKIEHYLKDIVVIVLLGTLANGDNWVEIAAWAEYNEKLLKKWLELPNGTPSHDTIERVMKSIKPEKFRELLRVWQTLLDKDEGEKLKKILAIDGKTIRGSGNGHTDPLHVVSAWSREGGVCFGQESENSKGKELPMIQALLEVVSVKGQIVTIDAIGTHKEIAQKIRAGKGDYVLAVKGNQPVMHEELKDYFEDERLRAGIERQGNYTKTVEKARGNLETREYWQSDDISWFEDRDKWEGLLSFGMTESTTEKPDGSRKVERRHYISSLKPDIQEFARAVRGHWSVESMHWQLDVLFREDNNHTLNRNSAENLNIVRKWALSILKTLDRGKKMSQKTKRFILCGSFEQFAAQILA